jgi:hypothetical protein
MMLVDRSDSQVLALADLTSMIGRLVTVMEGQAGPDKPKKNKTGPWTSLIEKARAERIVRDLTSAQTLLYVSY